MEKLKAGKAKNVSWEYDKEADILDISFGKPRPALSVDLGSGIVMRYLEDSKEVVGFTVIGLENVLKSKTREGSAAPC